MNRRMSYKIDKVRTKIRVKIQRWLGIYNKLEKLENIISDYNFIKKKIRRVEDEAIIGVDLGYRELSEVIIIKYSKLNNAFKVIANTETRSENYNRFVQSLRRLCAEHNATIIAIDAPMAQEVDLRSRILPDEAILEGMRERMD